MPRLFVAIDPPDAHKDALSELRDPELNVRWSRRDQYHLTLRFLGETDLATSDAVADGISAITSPPFEVRAYEGLNAFPSRRRPRVVIVRLELTAPLRVLQEMIEEEMQAVGFEPEQRGFTPHLTLARLKSASALEVREFMQHHQHFQLPPFEATQFHLYESQLHPEGARYRQLRTYELAD